MSMLSTLTSQLRPAVSVFALLTVVTGLAYPYAMNGLAQATFPADYQWNIPFDTTPFIDASIESVAQTITQEGERQHYQCHANRRGQQCPWLRIDGGLTIEQQTTP